MRSINILSIFLTLTLLFASCGKSDYKNVIPADVTSVASVELASIIEKGNLEQSPMMAMLQESFMTTDGTGLDISSPMYVFAMPNTCVGATMKVSDEAKLEAWLSALNQQGMAGEIVEREGVMWSSVFDDIDLLYTSDICLFMTSVTDEGSGIRKHTANRLMSLSEEELFVGTERYARMQKQNADDIVMLGDILAMEPLRTTLNSVLPAGKSVDKVETLVTLNFENGKLVCNAEISSEDEKVNALLDNIDSHLSNIEGRYVSTPSEAFLLWAGLGIEGDWLLQQLKASETTAGWLRMMNLAVDADKIIRSIDGDVACIVPNVEDATEEPLSQCVVLAHMENTDFLKDVDYWQESMQKYGMKMREVDQNSYVLSAADHEIVWGVEGEDLFVSTDKAAVTSTFAQRSTLLQPYMKDIKSGKLYVYCNLSALPMDGIAQVMQLPPMFATRFGLLEALCFKAESARKFRMEIVLKDKNVNFLKQIL